MKRTSRGIVIGLGLFAFLFSGVNIAFAKEKPAAAIQTKSPDKADAKTAAIKTIFDYASELKLSNEQVKGIRDVLLELNKNVTVSKAKLVILTNDLQDLIVKDGDIALIKTRIKEAFDIQANMSIDDIVGARRINSILTPEQIKKWHEIQAASAKKK